VGKPAQSGQAGALTITDNTSMSVVGSLTLAAAAIAGVDRVFSVGGAQAIAALAYGTESIPRVDKICGPGNIFVMLAKKAVALRTSTAPRIDGVLNEAEWQRAAPISDFLQREPDEGKPPTEKTEIRILYDDEALYFACRMYDREPSKIVARLARRDGNRAAGLAKSERGGGPGGGRGGGGFRQRTPGTIAGLISFLPGRESR